MPNYLVLTTNDRNLVIEADGFQTDDRQNSYQFFKKLEGGRDILVASVPIGPTVLAVIEQNDAFIDDFYDTPEEPNDDTDDVCLGCRFEEFLESEEFFDAVADIVGFILSGDGDDPAVPQTPEEPKVERRIYDGEPSFGISFEGTFYPFGDGDLGKKQAEYAVNEGADYVRSLSGQSIGGCPLAETEVIQ